MHFRLKKAGVQPQTIFKISAGDIGYGTLSAYSKFMFMKKTVTLLLLVFLVLISNLLKAQVFFPAGNGPGNAVPVVSSPYNTTGNTSAYSNNISTPVSFPGNTNAPDVWFKVIAPAGTQITAGTYGFGSNTTDFDSYMYIVDQNGSTILQDDGNSCGGPGAPAIISNFTIPAGNNFVYVVVDGWALAQGNYALTITGASLPAPTAASPQNFCTPPAATVANLSASGTGGTLNWYNVSSGGSALPSNTVLATGTYYVDQTIAGIPSSRTAVAVGVNPTPNVNAVANQLLCNGGVTNAINFSGATPGTVYNWTNSNPAIGLAASGTGNIAPFNVSNAGSTPVTATIIVTPSFTANGFTCTGTPRSFTITINPTAVANAVSPQALCNGAATAPINFSSTSAGFPASSIVYNWTNNDPSVGLAASGSGDIPSFAATNATGAPVVATVTVTPTFTYQGVSCLGAPSTFTITVYPAATVTPVSNQTLCTGVATSTINFTTPTTGGSVTYAWTNSNTAIGLAASGTGNIPSFTTTNATNAPIVATITVTPTFTVGAVSCTGTARTFTITINPATSVTAVANQAYCAGTVTGVQTFTSTVAGTTYSWTNDNPAIGLAASGTGDLPSFTAANTTNAPALATIMVTPVTPDGCTGTATTFTITVYPTAAVNAVSNQVKCNGSITNAVNFSSPTTGGTVTYNWTNDNTSIGLAANGTGNIAAFSATNGGLAPVTATITVTPTYTVGAVSCSGVPTTFTITVNPTALAAPIANQVLCNGTASTAVNFTSPVTGGTVTYAWANSNPAIGLPASGSGNLPSFTAVNAGTSPIGAIISVIPTFTNAGVSCTGVISTFTITVNPTATVNPVASQVLCNGTNSTAINFSSPASGGIVSYDWTNTAPSIGLAATGTGNIAAFTAVNNGTAPVVASITVTPTFTSGAVSCTGPSRTFTITVNPTATVNPVGNQTLCNGATTTAVTFGTNATGGSVTYNWTNSNATIGLAASGTGNIPAFTAVNATTAAVTATITVTPVFNNAGVNCTGTPTTFTITVNPSAVMNAVASQVLCTNIVTTPVVFTSPVAGTTYSWINNNTSIGLNASGTGNLPSFTTANTTNNPQVATITVTPTAPNGCTGSPAVFTITVNPVATVTPVANQTVCAGTSTAAVAFSSPATGGAVTYAWTNNNTSIGLAANGTGNIASFTAVNAGTAQVTATIIVTPTYTAGAVSCVGTPTSFTITVNPTATVNPINNQVLCNGAATSVVNFASTATGGTITYNWTNSDPSIGLSANGTGNIASFTAVNSGTSPVVATITVTPAYTNAGVTCTGTAGVFTITVNPTATVNPVTNQVVCAGAATAAFNFTSTAAGGTVTYAWTNSNASIGLATSGTGNIASFTAVNNGTAPVVATITVTPTFTNGAVSCAGPSRTFTITVNPTTTVNPVGNQTLCNGATTTAVTFATTATGGSVTYNWINSDPSIGLAAAGSGSIPSFTAINTGTAPVVATITVTPVYNNGGTNCTGTPLSFTITVNPTATVNAVANQVFCGNTASAPISFGGAVAGTVFNWVNDNPAIGLAASGSGNIPSFTTANNFVNPTSATITVTPVSPAGCMGAPVQFTISIMPVATVNAVANQVLCNGSSTNAIAFSTAAVGGTVTYNWTNSAASIGIAAGGTGNIPSFIATNSGLGPVTATIVVTPTYTVGATSCTGLPRTFTITVNPTVSVNAVANQSLCQGASTAAINFSTPNTIGAGSNIVYNWVNNTPSIGLAASGTGNIGSFTAVNNTNAPITATIVVTPVYTNAGVTCTGTAITFTITVNPIPVMNAVASQTLCHNGTTTAINFSSNIVGTSVTYNWINNNTTIGLAASGTGNIPAFTAINSSSVPVTATITVTPSIGGCVGTSITFNITVLPAGVVNAVANQVLCGNTVTAPIVFTSPVAGTTYSWVNNNTAIGLVASGTGNIPSFTTTNNLVNATTSTITVTPVSPSGCVGAPITFSITVNPIATVNAVANQVLCNGSSTNAIAFSTPATGGTTAFNWVNNTPSIGIAASGTGNIPSFIAVNTGLAPVTATITVTPVFTNAGVNCTGIPMTFTITVNPTVTVNPTPNQVLCNTAATAPISFTTPNTIGSGSNIVYNWVNNTPSIGLAASGTGNIGSFTAVNNSTAPVTATITVTPVYTNQGVTCTGTISTFTITVNPTATVNAVNNQVLCNGTATTAVNFSSPNSGGSIVYNWVNNTPSIGLAASGSGNIASFNAVNTTTLPVTANIVVTPVITNAGVSCTGTPISFNITVQPSGVVNPVPNQTVCANTPTTPVVFTSPISGTTYTWVNNNTTIGLAATGVGNIPSFMAVNTLNTINATVTVTPQTPFGCTGAPITFVYTINPIPTMNQPLNQVRCNGAVTDSILFSSPNGTNGGGNIVYNWTNSAPSIGIPASGTGNILPFTAVNTGTTPVVAIITVTPSVVNGNTCVGISRTFSITVNPTAVVNAINSQTLCAGQPTLPVNFTGPVAGTFFNWVNSNTQIGLAASGSGNIPSFIAQNNTLSTITGTVTVTPNTAFGCIGSPKSFDYIVQAVSVAPTGISTSITGPALLVCDTNRLVTLRVTGGGLGTGAVWKWYKDACGGTAIGTGPVLSNYDVTQTTTFYVRAEGTCNTTACASITIQVGKLITQVRQHWDDVLFFDNSSNNFVSWQWYKNGVIVPGATLQHYSENGVSLNGQYYCVATDKTGNQLITCPINCIGGGFHGIELRVIPNPVNKGQQFKVQSSLTPAELQGATITVTNVLGTQISQAAVTSTVTTLQAPATSGMYIVSLVLRNGQRYSITTVVN